MPGLPAIAGLTEVRRMHFGVVHILLMADPTIVGWRSGIVASEFLLVAGDLNAPTDYESWSCFCLENHDAFHAEPFGRWRHDA
ncbi:MAG TPA: hypothetical protein VLU94_02775 [Candidatus Nitrosotalea sp.]|nr:hypothetical protein [Candidatus Nitrosotalea sp.]